MCIAIPCCWTGVLDWVRRRQRAKHQSSSLLASWLWTGCDQLPQLSAVFLSLPEWTVSSWTLPLLSCFSSGVWSLRWPPNSGFPLLFYFKFPRAWFTCFIFARQGTWSSVAYQIYGGLFWEVCIPLSICCKVVTSFLTSHSLFMVGQTSRALFNAHTFRFMPPSSWGILPSPLSKN